MKEKELEYRLARAVEHAAPNDLEGVLSRCEERKGNVIVMTSKMTKKRVLSGLMAACLALVLLGGAGGVWYQQVYAVASVVSLDVNPSIELKVNRSEKVLTCTPLNEEAAAVLEDMGGGRDLEGTKLDVAVNAVVGALVRYGYFDGLSSAILVSVEDKDQARAAQLEEELKAAIGGVLEAQALNTTVLSQTLTQDAGYDLCGGKDAEVQGQQNDYHISNGKAALVQKVMERSGISGSEGDVAYQQAFEQLAALTVEELNDLLVTGETRIPIGKSAAAWAVEEYAGTLAMDSTTTDVDPELDERPAHYEVDLYTSWGKFEYKVDAFTGAILSGPANVAELAGRPAAGPAERPEPEPSAPVSTAVPSAPAATGSDLIGEEAAKQAALTDANCAERDTTYCKSYLDYDDGRVECYKVEFVVGDTRYIYRVDHHSGAVLGFEHYAHTQDHHGSGHHEEAHYEPSDSWPDIGQAAAQEAALNHAGLTESEVSKLKVKREEENGGWEYEVEFKQGGWEYEYTIDGATGKVLEFEKEKD